MINIAELLKDAPTGMKLYSPLFGECKLGHIEDEMFIHVSTNYTDDFEFDEFGQIASLPIGDNANGECLLFPSKDCRTWEGWKLPSELNLKVGDWIVQNDNGTVSQITKVINGTDEYGEYRAYEHTNGYFAACFENEYHLWTIKDAKDGDVLATDSGWTCIFQAFDGCGFSSYCFMDSEKWFNYYGSETHTLDSRINGNIHPATKEQRTQFFKRMQEVGYQWYAGKKELRKIIKPKFKVGDEIKTGNTIETIAEIDYATRSYCCESGRIIWFENQDLWHLAPKPHYDIGNFHAGMPVLVRDSDEHKWLYTIFGIYNKDNSLYPFVVVNMRGYEQCIPFNDDTKHLLGTTEPCGEEFINW